MVAGCERERGSCQTGFGVVFGAKPSPSEAPVGAAAERRPPGRGRSGKDAKPPSELANWSSVDSEFDSRRIDAEIRTQLAQQISEKK